MPRSMAMMALGVALATAATAQEVPQPTSPAKGTIVVTGEKPKPEKKICRSEMETGSHMPGPRTCMTKAQWDEQARSAQGFTSGAQNYGAPPPTQGGR